MEGERLERERGRKGGDEGGVGMRKSKGDDV